MEFKDYYKVMGLERAASQDEIKRAYRKLARKFHPDVSKAVDAEERFKEVGEAYEVLKDPEKRAAYDQLGSDWEAGQNFRAPPGWDAGFEFQGDGDPAAFSDFFESLFGHGFRNAQTTHVRRGPHAQGEDHHAKVLIDLEDAWHGTARVITLGVPGLDERGRLVTNQRSLHVRIPKGVKQGQHIRLSGQGSPGLGDQPAGDLYLQVEFAPHALYRAEGRDIYLDVPVAPWEAALGATIKIPTPDGAVELKVPAQSASGRTLRLRKRGMPGNPRGDLYVVVRISLPTADTDEARALYRKMERELAFNPREHLGV